MEVGEPRDTRGMTLDFDVAIVGTGFSGLGMAIQLLKEKRRSFVVLEKADDVGGTWRDNHYPGCACDVPSHVYSYSFERNPRWSRMYAPQAEILAYLKHCADKYGVRPHIRFGSEVTRAEFDERGAFWRVQTANGKILTARHLVLGIGALSRPLLPKIAGLDRFRGETFHSAAWNHDYDLDGKTVGVIGTGASAIQFVPQIAAKVGKLHLFQRTPPWILPKPDGAIGSLAQRFFEAAPVAERLFRYGLYWTLEATGVGFTVAPKVMQLVAALGRRHIQSKIPDERLRALVTPSYRPGCKRILLADDYYPALARPNVEVVTEGLAEVTENAVITRDGVERPVDALIFGTGFRVTDLLTPMKIFGRNGAELNETWRGGVEAYLGATISGFPNLYMLMGPNTGLGHNSMIFMIEAQVHYAIECMRRQDTRGARSADVRPGAQTRFNDEIQPRLRRAVWASGCQSWYLDANGKNSTTWPGFTFEYWLRTRRMREQDYEFDPAPVTASAPFRASSPSTDETRA
jgi:cation diffusion facilitator CzcD-associated flavoprotein CzcO